MPNYATLNDLKDQTPDTLLADVDDVTLGRLVTHATLTIRRATRNATYSTDDDHLPRSETLRHTFRDATIAQVRSWLEADAVEDVLTGGATAEATLSSTSSNGKSITLDNSTATTARTHLVSGGLGAEAELILDTMGLLGGMPGVYR